MTVPASPLFSFENSFVRDLEGLYVDWKAAPAPDPSLVVANALLAEELGLNPDALQTPEGVAVLAGNSVPETAMPIAMAYSGHQFGGFSPVLGDGRALLLGELVDGKGQRHDVHLKGSGRTPFARGGDGKAALGPMLREYLLAEAMHALGVPTTRALAVLKTGEPIFREGMVPGGILVRVASSHLRVGTFEFAVRLESTDGLLRLADYAVERHYPEVKESSDPNLALFDSVLNAQAGLVAKWMQLGFIHGVLNTDNVTISGEGIDYGPCAFMDTYDPATVFSSIDHKGRYAFGNQPGITQWNLARFAGTLVTLMGDDPDAAIVSLTESLNTFPDLYRQHWLDGMATKFGLVEVSESDEKLVEDYLALLQLAKVDYTSSFRSLAAELRGDRGAFGASFGESDAATSWLERWRARLQGQGVELAEVADQMDSVNPVYIPRNHLVEEALEEATIGNLEPFHQLLAVVENPYEKRKGLERYAEPAPEGFTNSYRTFCGT